MCERVSVCVCMSVCACVSVREKEGERCLTRPYKRFEGEPLRDWWPRACRRARAHARTPHLRGTVPPSLPPGFVRTKTFHFQPCRACRETPDHN